MSANAPHVNSPVFSVFQEHSLKQLEDNISSKEQIISTGNTDKLGQGCAKLRSSLAS